MGKISSEEFVVKEVLNDTDSLISINKKYFDCEWSPAGDDERRQLLNEYQEIRTRINYQFLIHSEVVEPESNGQSREWTDLQGYVLRYFDSPANRSTPSFDAYKKSLRPVGIGGK